MCIRDRYKVEAGAGGLDGTADPLQPGINGHVTFSSSLDDSSTHGGLRAFNNSLSKMKGWKSQRPSSGDEWIQFEFPYEKIISMYRIWPVYEKRNRQDYEKPPKSWKLLATNDNAIAVSTTTTLTDWTELDDVSLNDHLTCLLYTSPSPRDSV